MFVEISTHLGGKHMMFTFICLSLLIFVCNSFQTSVCVLFFVVVSKMKDMWYLVGWLIYIVCRAVIFKQVHPDHCWPRAPFIK